jgi:hypothetical protein
MKKLFLIALGSTLASAVAANATTYHHHHHHHRVPMVVNDRPMMPPPPARVAVVPCQYPHGWDLGDFVRDVNGRPEGINHSCVEQ